MSDSIPAGSAPAGAPGLDQKIQKIEQDIVELNRIQARSRRMSLIVLLIVAVEFAIFALLTRTHVEANFNDQDMQKAIADRLPDVTPRVRDSLVQVVQHEAPVYRELAMARFKVAGPVVAKDAMTRLENLPQENGEEMKDRLNTAFDKTMTRIEPDIKATYPTLSDSRKTEIIHSEFQKLIDQQNEGMAQHVTSIYVAEQESMRTILDKFDIPGDVGTMSPTARQRELLHAMVDVVMDGDINLDLSAIGPQGGAAAAAAPESGLTVLAKPAPGSSLGN